MILLLKIMHQEINNLIVQAEKNNNLLNQITEVNNLNNISTIVFLSNLLITIILSLIVAFCYTKYGRTLSNRKEFSSNFALLAMITMFIITIVKSSLALSLGLVGALSIVRFRSAIKEPEELIFLFLSIAIGLGLGANQRLITLIATITIIIFIFIRSKIKNTHKNKNMNLIINYQKSKEINFDDLIEIISKTSPRTDILRYSENESDVNSCLIVNLNSFSEMQKLRKNIFKKYPYLSLDFIENSDL